MGKITGRILLHQLMVGIVTLLIPSMAAAAEYGPQQPSMLAQVAPLILLLVVIYFVYRSRKKKQENLGQIDKKTLGKDFWIDNLRQFFKLLFVIIVIGGVIGGVVVRDWIWSMSPQRDVSLGLAVIIGSLIVSCMIGVLSVGFAMVFLNLATDTRINREYLTQMAADIKTIKKYLTENREKRIPVKVQSQQSSKDESANIDSKIKQPNKEGRTLEQTQAQPQKQSSKDTDTNSNDWVKSL